MKKPLRALIVEDSEFDAQMLVSLLRKSGYDPAFDRVETAEALKAALAAKTWDIVLADYNLPHFNALAAWDSFRKPASTSPSSLCPAASAKTSRWPR